MRTIFLPTDFSPKSENAMKYAAEMFHTEPIHFVLIHSYDIPYQPNEVIISSILETLKEDVEKNLILIKGAIPGPKKGLVTIKKTVKN